MSAPRRGPLVALALLVVAVVVALLVWALQDDPPVPEPAPREGSGAAVRGAGRRPAPVGPKAPRPAAAPQAPEEQEPAPVVAEPAAAPVSLRRVVTVRVVVRRSGGGPAEGAAVHALDPLGGHLSPPGPIVRATKTADAAGRVEFGISGGTTVLRVLASLEGEAAVSDTIDLATGDERHVELDLVVSPALRVRITGPDGAGIAAASVEAAYFRDLNETWPVTLTLAADAEGAVSFPAVPLGEAGAVVVRARARGFVPAQRVVRTSVVRVGVVGLRLDRGESVRGRAVDERGTPVPNAAVRIVGAADVEASDADGRFEVAGLPASGGALWVQRAEFAPTIVRGLRGGAGDVDVGDVILRPGGLVAGVVVDSQGAPVAGAAVRVRHQDADADLADVQTAADGTFSVDHMPDEALVVEASEPRKEKGWAAGLKAQVRDVRPGRDGVRLVLTGAATVHVRFVNDVDMSAVVVSSVRLTATPVGATVEEAAWAWSGANIDAVRFRPDATGVFDVTVEIPGWDAGVARAVEVAPDRETRIDVVFRKRE